MGGGKEVSTIKALFFQEWMCPGFFKRASFYYTDRGLRSIR